MVVVIKESSDMDLRIRVKGLMGGLAKAFKQTIQGGIQ